MNLSIQSIAEKIGARLPDGAAGLSAEVAGYSIDTRTINPGECFFALRGPLHDGHNYLPKLPEKAAALAVVQHLTDVPVLQLVVPDTEKALQTLATKARLRWNGTIVGVTGSAGKTTTKDAVAVLLGVEMRTGRTIGNYNNHIGLPLSILRIDDDCRAAVIEMGMNHAGEIRELTKIARPQIGVVTNVGRAHAEFFDDGIEGVSRAKRELIEGLPADGVAVLNVDDSRVRRFSAIHPGRSILFGFGEGAEVRAENLRECPKGSHFRCLGVDFETSLFGRHNVSNILAAISVAQAVGIAPDRLRDAVKSLTPARMRGERFERAGITVINDCYNANPEAVRSMLELLAGMPGRRKIAVLGEMLELGREAGTLHREIGKLTAGLGINALVGIRGAARQMVDEAMEAVSDSAAPFLGRYFDTAQEAGEFLQGYASPGDVVLFKGSRGVGVERAIDRMFGDAAPSGRPNL